MVFGDTGGLEGRENGLAQVLVGLLLAHAVEVGGARGTLAHHLLLLVDARDLGEPSIQKR